MNASSIRSIAWALLAIPLLLLGAPAQAANATVRDQAGFFSESAQSTTTRILSEIEKSLKRDLVIETYREIPAEARKGLDLQDKAAVNRVFETWSVQRARELGVQGIYVVMTREPAHLQIAVGNETQRQAFTLADRNALAERMLERLRAKKNDEALIAGVSFVRDTLLAHRTPTAKPSSSSQIPTTLPAAPSRSAGTEAPGRGSSFLSGLLPILIVGVLVLVVIRILGRLFSGGSMGGATPGMGGGGFMRSMLGGLFGAAAGMWLYNQFSGMGGNAFGAETPPTSEGGDNGGFGQDTDYSSSGGDFGDSSGGGDSGGGDSGGGGGDF